jgi:FkbM family methyltransferase
MPIRIGHLARAMLGPAIDDARFRASTPYRAAKWVLDPAYAAEKRRERRFYRRLLGPGRSGLIFDLGASGGGKAEIFRRHGRVLCVEPGAESARCLHARFSRCRDVSIVQAAVAQAAGRATYFDFGGGSAYGTLSDKWVALMTDPRTCQSADCLTVPVPRPVAVVTIDSLIAAHGTPRYIKLDVEGYERQAIEGMSRPCALLSAEFNLPHFSGELESVMERLQTLGGPVTFNVAITEPPIRLEFAQWLPATESLARIRSAEWRYVELFCRTTIDGRAAAAD